jgi:hypothetical protein
MERALDPKVKKVWIISALTTAGVLMLFALPWELLLRPRVAEEVPFGLSFLAVLVLCVPSLVLVNRTYANWRYQVNGDEVLVRHGVLWKTERGIPRHRIQHVDVTSGPIDRHLGLAELSVFTAGSLGAVVKIPGLDAAEAERLRTELLVASRR